MFVILLVKILKKKNLKNLSDQQVENTWTINYNLG